MRKQDSGVIYRPFHSQGARDRGGGTRPLRIQTFGIRCGGRSWLTGLVYVVVLVALWLGSAGHAQAQSNFISRENAIKAAYLYNFGKYVTWPENASASKTFRIGIVGKNGVTDRLKALVRNKSMRGRPIIIKEFDSAEKYKYCHILFVPSGQNQELVKAILQKATQSSTLTVGEERDFVSWGGIINFYLEGNNLKFKINPPAAERVGLTISSKLLSVGKVIRP